MSAVAPAFHAVVVQALLGPDRSPLAPETLWLGWLDADGELIAMSGTSVPHEAFGATESGVENADPVDAGVAGSGWVIAAVGLFADPNGEELFVTATLDEPLEPDDEDELAFDVGGLAFDYAGGESSA